MALFNSLVEGIIIPALTYFYEHLIPNYGVSIILLTIVIKVIFYPLSLKQFKAMKMTQKIQPEVKKIQEKFKNDPQQMQKEMLKIWKENGANPFSGCLPSLVQLPIFLAIFYAVKSETFLSLLEQPGINKGFLWMQNIALPDNLYILPVLIGITMFWSQKMMTIDPKQAKIFMFMPIIMGVVSINMPGGVLLYWVSSMLFSNIQQAAMLKKPEPETQPDVVTIKPKKVGKAS